MSETTNSATGTNSVTSSLQNPAPNTAADIQKVFQDFGVSMSLTGAAVIVLLAKAFASWYRNFALKDTVKSDVGAIKNGIAHFAGQSLPEVLPNSVAQVLSTVWHQIPKANLAAAADLTATPPTNPPKINP